MRSTLRDVLYLSDAYLRVGRLDEALRTGQRALDVARISSQRGREAWALRLLGDIGTARRETDDALRHYGHALALGTELGMRPLAAHCHLGLRALYQRTGRREQAQKHLTTAAAMYREMEMRFYLEQAEAR